MTRWTDVAVMLVVGCGPGAVEGGAPATVQKDSIEDSILAIGEMKLKPIRITVPDGPSWRTKDLVLSVVKGEVIANRTTDGSRAWRAVAPERRLLQGLATGDDIFYIQQWESYRDGERDLHRPDGAGALRRLSLKDGAWLDSLEALPGKMVEGGYTGAAREVLPLEGGVAVLSSSVKDSGDFHETQVGSYRISFFRGKETTPVWQRDFKSAGEVPSPGAGLLTPGGPRYARAEVNSLSLAGDKLVVCAGASEDIIAFNLADGRELWRLEAVWEFERGFIGPSVWQHFISRFGRHDFGYRQKVDPEERKTCRKHCRIIGGPLVVRHGEGHQLFVAVSKASGAWGGYLSNCLVYEIDDKGKPVAIIPMPRMIIGSGYRLLSDGVLWRCERGAMARITPSRQTRGIGGGPFNQSDCIGRLAWYMQPTDEEVVEGSIERDSKWWMTMAKAGDPTCFDESMLFRLPEGGYVKKQGDREFHFPISRLAIPGGQVTPMTLTVPYPREITPPETNLSRSGGRIRTLTPHLMAITNLNYYEGDLEVTIASQERAWILVFRLGK